MNKKFMTSNEIKAEWKLLGLALLIVGGVAALVYVIAPIAAPLLGLGGVR